ncbi:MYG1 family protein [Verrucomicrobiaceae bacterium 5K15]|uniref:MYG1 family protein n=1 Tax=Oceaniferula flava TaxID=2800421 RepID=A0AAE2SAR3_9BACT|nr:MYG1 family protein [Oceaniferula flavus]MBK1853972.1 MYG1 family protein [Oceaniferula flavus]MBM1135278.1 MYG1 family protein [Oceaniferula flavus]
MNINSIITHPGGAHKDDFLACSLLVAEHNVPIYRKDPCEEELKDPSVAVVDVGHVHEPENSNFDHHQFPRDYPPTCALTLVLQHLGIYEDAKMFCDWLEPAEWFDTRGPKKTAEWLGVEREVISKMNSPIDITVLRRFAQAEKHQPGEVIYELMKMIGGDLLEYLRDVRTRLDTVGQHVQRWEIDSGDETFSALYFPRLDDPLDDASSGLARYILVNNLDQEIAAMVYPDSRGEGFGLARFNDHPKLDFTRIEEDADVHFAHNSGFLCKTSATEVPRLQEQLAGAWG